MGKGKGMLNRETAEGKSKAGSTKTDDSLQPGKTGYHRSDFGQMEKENHRISDGHTEKDESPGRLEGSSIHDIAHHSVTGELYSGHPARHGHIGKVAMAAGKDKPNVDAPHPGGSTNEEEND